MYEKHIRELVELRDVMHDRYADDILPAIDAAIELMRAAEPKDEAAERGHCRKKAYEFGYSEIWIEIRAEELMGERAQARAERHVEICVLRKDVDEWKRLVEAAQAEIDRMGRDLHGAAKIVHDFKTKLEAAQAELARLQAKVADDALTIGALKDSIAAAQAELEKWRASDREHLSALKAAQAGNRSLAEANEAALNVARELETKLANLRTTTQRVRRTLLDVGCDEESACASWLLEAIEASKK